MTWQPYSKRDEPPPDTLRYTIPANVRSRITNSLDEFVGVWGGDASMQLMFADAGRAALKRYGVLESNISHADHPFSAYAEHYNNCGEAQLLDFLEWCFRSQHYRAAQEGVDIVNNIFREEGIGYEFSPYIMEISKQGATTTVRVTQYPEVTRKSNSLVHSTTVMPALRLLSGKPVWVNANAEMRKAHEHHRNGNHADAIHGAGKCLESVLKIICDTKGWPYQPDKDSLNPLLQACHRNSLFASPYLDVFQRSSGEIRNKWGGHGQGPKPQHGTATSEMAEHMIQITSAHILLLAQLAGM